MISYNLKNELLPPNLDDEDTGCSEKTARDVLQVETPNQNIVQRTQLTFDRSVLDGHQLDAR